MVIYQPKPLVITAGQLPTDMPKGYTSNVARKTPKEAKKKKARQMRGLVGGLDQLLIRQPMPKMVRELKAKRKAEAEERAFELQAMMQHLMERRVEHDKKFPPKKKKKDVPPRFKLIIPPVH